MENTVLKVNYGDMPGMNKRTQLFFKNLEWGINIKSNTMYLTYEIEQDTLYAVMTRFDNFIQHNPNSDINLNIASKSVSCLEIGFTVKLLSDVWTSSIISLSLGLASSNYLIKIPEQNLGNEGFWESLAGGINFVWSNITVVWQFLTLQTELPALLSFFMISPFILAIILIIILWIRGV